MKRGRNEEAMSIEKAREAALSAARGPFRALVPDADERLVSDAGAMRTVSLSGEVARSAIDAFLASLLKTHAIVPLQTLRDFEWSKVNS